MPDEPEVDSEALHDTIKEELDKEGGRFLRQIALTTALLAACAAIAALKAGATVNQALVLKTEATRLQAEASDLWAYYQAKGIKAATQEAARTSWLAIGKEAPAEYETAAKKYKSDQEAIQEKAREKERERDERDKEADHLLHEHHGYANAVALFQVSIALGAVSALTRNRLVWLGSLAVGLAGLGVFLARLLA